jgi:hypothetical protein
MTDRCWFLGSQRSASASASTAERLAFSWDKAEEIAGIAPKVETTAAADEGSSFSFSLDEDF